MGPPRAESGNRFGSSRMGLAQNQFLQPEIVTKASGSPYTYLYIMVRWICMRPMIWLLQGFVPAVRESVQWLNEFAHRRLLCIDIYNGSNRGGNVWFKRLRLLPVRWTNKRDQRFVCCARLANNICEEWRSISERGPMHRAKTIWFVTFKINK